MWARFSSDLVKPMAALAPRASSCASATAAGIKPSSGSTRFTKPKSSASGADSMRPVKHSSLARLRPVRRVSRYRPPVSGTRPTLTKAWLNCALSATSTRSHASARFIPAPTAAPFTAAMTGFSSRSSGISTVVSIRCSLLRPASGVGSAAASISRISPPAQNARPAPVRMTARTAASAASAGISAASSRCIGWLNAFSASGRFSVTVATPSATLQSRVS